MTVDVILGDCLVLLRDAPDDSVDSCVTDPPYHLTSNKRGGSGDKSVNLNSPAGRARISTGFMNQEWDGGDIAFRVELWREVYRVLKPGAHLVAFSGTRTYHRMACAIEDAGFEIRDQLAWVYGSGFPKSLDVSKAIDKSEDYKLQAAIRRAAVDAVEAAGLKLPGNSRHDWTVGEHAPGNKWWAEFQQWLPSLSDRERQRVEGEIVARVQKAAGWFTSKDIYEVRAPATDAAQQWHGWGTALKPAWEPICLARKPLIGTVAQNVLTHGTGALNIDGCRIEGESTVRTNTAEMGYHGGNLAAEYETGSAQGRWPANLVHDGSDEVVAGFPESGGGHHPASRGKGGIGNDGHNGQSALAERFDSEGGSAARFFYSAKAGKLDRLGSEHPTVKPVALMGWLVRLITPPGGTVLDPFAGTGTTGIAAFVEGFDAILMELRQEAVADINRRLDHIRGLGRITALEMAKLDEKAQAKARGDDLPLLAL